MDTDPDSVQRPTVTWLSRWGTGLSRIRPHLLRLVRSSHCASVVLAMLTPGCLIPEPAAWEGLQRTRPQLIEPITPPTNQFIVLSGAPPAPNTLTVTVSEQSENAGEALRAIWYLDKTYLNSMDIAPGHIDDPPKLIKVVWPVSITQPECVPFTLLVTYVNYDSNDLEHTPLPQDADYVATITWWLDLNDNNINTSDTPLLVSGCPASGG